MEKFKLTTDFSPKGDQPQAIEKLVVGLNKGIKHQVLLGITGSGKTFTMANVVARVNRPTLVIAPNKTLAAQLFAEFRDLFPENSVHYFVSYYDYYQPEAYKPQTDTYIEKDASINDEIDKLRHAATQALLTRRDVIVVASVSCIYGIGEPETYQKMYLSLKKGDQLERETVLRKLVDIHYERSDFDFHRGTFRVRGDVVDIFPVNEAKEAVRVEFFGDKIEQLSRIDSLKGEPLGELKEVSVFPATHYVTSHENLTDAFKRIEEELKERVSELKSQNKLLEAERLESRTNYDLEMMREMGFCPGIENYSRHLSGRAQGEPPATLLDYYDDDFLIFIDESHLTIPQLGGMYEGDRARKLTLVEYGFRLPSALDNRPLNFKEFETRVNQLIYVSATPAEYEIKKSRPQIVEQLIRPTGLMDPEIEVRPARHQVENFLGEIKERIKRKERVLVTTLTKKMAEDLSSYYQELGVKVKYLHSDIETLERVAIIRDLRLGRFDVLVGINLLREGLDLPEVSLVGILDADKEGFLRSARSLIQTCGRAARNLYGKVILYADIQTKSINETVKETLRRRTIQQRYNQEHGISPQTIKKSIKEIIGSIYEKDYVTLSLEERGLKNIPQKIEELKKQMLTYAKNLEFEKAAKLRDQIVELQDKDLGIPSNGPKQKANI